MKRPFLHLCCLIGGWLILAAPVYARDPAAPRIASVAASSPPQLVVTFSAAAGDPLQTADLQVLVDDQVVAPTAMQLTPVELGLTVVIVADFSATLNDVSTPHSTRLRDQVLQLGRLLDSLPPTTNVALITCTPQAAVAAPLEPGSSAARAAIDRLAHRPLPARAAGAAELAAAINLGLAQFAPEEAVARALFVFGAGAPGTQLPANPFNASLTALGANPPLTTVVGFGDNRPGTFIDQPANPAQLRAIAEALNGRFYPFFSSEMRAVSELQTSLAARYQSVGATRRFMQLQLTLPDLAPGLHQLELRVRGAGAAINFTIPAAPAQAAVATVTPSEQQSTARGRPAVAGYNPIATTGLFLLVSLAAIAGWQLSVRLRSRTPQSFTGRLLQSDSDELAGAALDATTARYGDAAGTERFTASATPATVGWRLRIDDDGRVFEVLLSERQATIGKEAQNSIRLTSRWVSGVHARLTLAGATLQITDLNSTNGTFRGAACERQLPPHTPVDLPPGSVIWLGPAVSLTVVGAQ